jgi:hypothetical protein
MSLLNSLFLSSFGDSFGGVSGEFSRDKLDGFKQDNIYDKEISNNRNHALYTLHVLHEP